MRMMINLKADMNLNILVMILKEGLRDSDRVLSEIRAKYCRMSCEDLIKLKIYTDRLAEREPDELRLGRDELHDAIILQQMIEDRGLEKELERRRKMI